MHPDHALWSIMSDSNASPTMIPQFGNWISQIPVHFLEYPLLQASNLTLLDQNAHIEVPK